MLDECLVRAIVLRHRADGRPPSKAVLDELEEDYRAGNILEPFFFQQLLLYEKQPRPLIEFCPAMVSRIDAQDELRKWDSV